MTHLFISHSSSDRALAEQVKFELDSCGYESVFLDTDPSQGIPVGAAWERDLYRQLRSSDGLVFVGSDSSEASRWCFAEVALARSLGTPIFGVSVGPGPRSSLLGDLQWVDVTAPGAYSRLADGLRQAGLDPSRSFEWDRTRSPYPGLKAFSSSDAAVFFGRAEEVRRLTELLHPTLARGGGRWISIIGPSGSGKSSLLHAGLLPGIARMDREWVIVPSFVPGRQPIRNLARSLAAAMSGEMDPKALAALEEDLRSNSIGTSRLLKSIEFLSSAGDGAERKVLLSIDQAEELVTRSGRVEQRRFLELLDDALARDIPLWVVCTLRSEFLSNDPDRAGLSEVTDDALVVEPLSRNRLPEVIAQPARRAGLEFDEGLVDRMVQETTGGDALPLLAYTLYELTRSSHSSRLIRHADYEAIGGVVGALQGRADQLVDELTARGFGEYILPTLLKFVSVDQDGEPIRRRLPRHALSTDEQYVVDTFVEARLLVASGQDAQHTEAVIEVAHEALMRQWSPLRDAIDHSRASIQMRAELEREAADWDRRGRDESWLLRGGRLVTIEEWVGRDAPVLSEAERRFLQASRELTAREIEGIRRSNRRLRQLLVAAVALLVAAAGSGVFAVLQAGEARQNAQAAQQQSRIALTRQLLADAVSLRSSQPELGLLLNAEAVRLSPNRDLEIAGLVHLRQALNRTFHIATPLVHTDVINAVSYSGNSFVVAAAGKDHLVHLWDTRTGRKIKTLAGHTDEVRGVAFSPQDAEGTVLASASDDGTIRLWDTSSGAVKTILAQGLDKVGDVMFNGDGSVLAASTDDGLLLAWTTTDGKAFPRPLVRTGTDTTGGPALWRLAFSPQGDKIAVGGMDGKIRVVDMSTRTVREPMEGHSGWVNGVAFSPDGTRLASAGEDGTVRMWEVSSGSPIGEPIRTSGGELTDIAVSPDGAKIAAGGRDGLVRLWDANTQRLLEDPMAGHANAVRGLAFSPDGTHLASASYDQTIRLWRLARTSPVPTVRHAHIDRVNDLAFRPDGRLLASVGADGTLRLWDPETGKAQGQPLHDSSGTGKAAWVGAVAFSPNGQLIATASADKRVRLWDVATRTRLRVLDGHLDEVSSVAFDSTGTVLASADRAGTIKTWRITDGHSMNTMSLPSPAQGLPKERALTDIAFLPGKSILVSVGQDGTVRSWDASTGQSQSAATEEHAGWSLAVAVDPSGQRIASAGGDGIVRIWNSEALTLMNRLRGTVAEVTGVALGESGRLVASVGKDGNERIWAASDGKPVGEPISGPAGSLTAVAFSPAALDFRTAVAGANGDIRLVTLDRQSTLAQACEVANRDLTKDEWDQYVGDGGTPRTCPGR